MTPNRKSAGVVLLLFAAIAIMPAAGCRLVGARGIENMIQSSQERVFPTLVFIKPIRQQVTSGERVRSEIVGSGVIISPDGLLVTNSHVARETTEIKCVLYDSELVSAKLIGLDLDTDLALLKIELPSGHAPLPAAQFGDSSKLRPGQFVMAFGSPYGLSRSVSLGVVSSPRRYLEIGPYSTWIQTDTPINPGNSGGPLVDEHGRVIGINTLRLSAGEGIGFAIPSNTVQKIIGQIQEHGSVERSFVGLQLQPLRDFTRDIITPGDKGVVIGGVDELSPASDAGFRAGDLLLKLNGQPVTAVLLEDIPDLRAQFAALKPDVPVTAEVSRGGAILELTLKPKLKLPRKVEGTELEMWNCSVNDINKFETPGLAYFVPRGVYIMGARNPGNARDAGLQGGDIIIAVNNQPVTTVEELMDTYKKLSQLERGKRNALIEIQRGGYREYIALDFNRDYKREDEE